MKTLLICAAALLAGAPAGAQPAAYQGAPMSLSWIDRPWEYRYLLKVEDEESFKRRQESKPDEDKRAGEPATAYFFGAFTPSWVLQPPMDEGRDLRPPRFAVLRVEIKDDRSVITPSDWGVPLEARLNKHERVVLVPREAKPTKIIYVGDFFMGHFGASDQRYSPSICADYFGDDVLPAPNSFGRYATGDFDPFSHGYFGCREWAAQLYDSSRPYIDVTSYEYALDYNKKTKSGPHKGDYPLKKPLTLAPAIKHFIGFSRFEDPAKPVIGNHRGQWLCLNDCPNGEAPGPIADIKAWAVKRGWPVPKPPRNVREFMDKRVDQNEIAD